MAYLVTAPEKTLSIIRVEMAGKKRMTNKTMFVFKIAYFSIKGMFLAAKVVAWYVFNKL